MKYFKDLINKQITSHYTELEVVFTMPPSREAGHISIPCFHFSKVLRQSPNDIARKLSILVRDLEFIDHVEVVQVILTAL